MTIQTPTSNVPGNGLAGLTPPAGLPDIAMLTQLAGAFFSALPGQTPQFAASAPSLGSLPQPSPSALGNVQPPAPALGGVAAPTNVLPGGTSLGPTAREQQSLRPFRLARPRRDPTWRPPRHKMRSIWAHPHRHWRRILQPPTACPTTPPWWRLPWTIAWVAKPWAYPRLRAQPRRKPHPPLRHPRPQREVLRCLPRRALVNRLR